MDVNNKELLFDHLKTKVKTTSGTFNLALNHGSQSFGLADTIESAYLNMSQSLLMLFKLNPEGSGKPETLGIYYHRPEGGSKSLPLYWNAQCFVFVVKEGEQVKFMDGASQVGKTMINLQKEEMFDFDSDYSYMDERFLEFRYNDVNFGEISFTSEFSSSYFGLEIVWPNKTAVTFQLDCGEYWLF